MATCAADKAFPLCRKCRLLLPLLFHKTIYCRDDLAEAPFSPPTIYSTDTLFCSLSCSKMPQLATAMHSVPLSCPLYLDVNNGAFKPEHNNVFTKAPFHEATDTSKNMLEMSFLYENFVKGQANMYQLNPNLLAESFNYYLNQNCRGNEKSVSPKSFSIESILGFPNSSPHSSTSSKDVFCNQFTLADFPASSGHCQVSATEFVTCADSYRQPLTGHVFESAKAKGKPKELDYSIQALLLCLN